MKVLVAIALTATSAAQAPKISVDVKEISGAVTVQFSERGQFGFRALDFDTPAGHTRIHLLNAVVEHPPGPPIDGTTPTSSGSVYIGQYTKDGADHTLLFMMGENGLASSDAPASVAVIGFNSKGQPYKVLERATFAPVALVTNSSGTHIAGVPDSSLFVCGFEDVMVHTYDPFAVYTIDAKGRAQLDPTETEKYNREHYIWAGPKAGYEVLVFHNFPGHSGYFIPSAKDAQELMARYCK